MAAARGAKFAVNALPASARVVKPAANPLAAHNVSTNASANACGVLLRSAFSLTLTIPAHLTNRGAGAPSPTRQTRSIGPLAARSGGPHTAGCLQRGMRELKVRQTHLCFAEHQRGDIEDARIGW